MEEMVARWNDFIDIFSYLFFSIIIMKFYHIYFEPCYRSAYSLKPVALSSFSR